MLSEARRNLMCSEVKKNVNDRVVNQSSSIRRWLLNPRSLLVGYALIDLIWNFARIQLSVAKAFSDGIDLAYSPFYIHRWLDSLLLLLASVGLRLSRLWSYCAAIIASGWLLYRGVEKWERIAEYGLDLPLWSWPVVRSWWLHHSGQWDFPRLVLAVAVLAYCSISLTLSFLRKNIRLR